LLDRFNFSSHGCGKKEEFVKRKEKLLSKITKSVDKEGDVLFTNDEISSILDRLDTK
jgi:hypothetical protein